MSLITQCPACATMFKVVPDQLRISDGWVRCGQCDEVFDANANLAAESAAPVLPPPREQMVATSPDPDWAASLRFASDEGPPPNSVGFKDPADEFFTDSPGPAEAKAVDHLRSPGLEGAIAQESAALDDFLSQSPKSLAQTPGVDQDTPALETPAAPALESMGGAAPRYTQTQVKVVVTDEPKQPSFMRSPRRSSVWRRTGVRFLLALLVAALVGALGVQVALQERDRWAAHEPAAVPVLQALCGVAACTLSPLRNIEAVVIDSSSFTKVRADVYRLNVVLKNNGVVPVAPPALELTLTDMQDQSLIRRVLKPVEVGFVNATLEPGAEFSAVLPLTVKPGNPSERVSGYRLIAFYP